MTERRQSRERPGFCLDSHVHTVGFSKPVGKVSKHLTKENGKCGARRFAVAMIPVFRWYHRLQGAMLHIVDLRAVDNCYFTGQDVDPFPQNVTHTCSLKCCY